jgi:NADPH:quinone reductase-like Zn-dependent oxidoreductase
MKGWQVNEFGGPEVMFWDDLPEMTPGPREVVVDVRASGINFAETRMRAGTYGGQQLPFVMGMESSGIVHAAGSEAGEFKPGDRVFGRARGSHAERVVFDADHLMPLPENLSFEQGAAIPVGWLTAWHAVRTVAQVQPGQRVLIEAVASSVGSAALQIAKWRGCWVGGTASRDDKLELARPYGADALYNYKAGNLSERVLADTDGKGVDIGMMTIGEETAEELFDSMGMDGIIVMYGSTGGRKVCFSLNIGSRNLQLRSMSISTSAAFMTTTMPDFRQTALPLFNDGTLRPVVDTVLPMADVVKAHAMVDSRKHFGKVILAN